MKPTSFRCSGEYCPKEVMGTVIGVWKLFYELGAMVHSDTGILGHFTGVDNHAFVISATVAAAALF